MMIQRNNCTCKCHKCHLAECTDCILNHHHLEQGDKLTFTDSYVADMISEYFHRYSPPGERLGTFYYEMILSNMVSGKITELPYSKMYHLDYLFKHRKQSKIFKLIHRGIILFLSRNGKGDIARDYDERGKLQWRINNEN